MRLRSLVAMAATSVLSLHAPAQADWPAHDANQDGVIGFPDLNDAIGDADFGRLNQVLADWGRVVGPDVVGDPLAEGADAKAIARWDAIPGQFVDDLFRVGVVAFHMNEIREVRFFLDGQPYQIVRSRTKNPDTGIDEFWVTINPADFAEGEIRLSALVLPNTGIPRILDGLFSVAATWNGEHELPLVVRHTPPPRVYVGYGGSDTNPGTREAPFATIGKAIRVVPDGGEVILLNAGGYDMPQNGYGHMQRNNARWITVRPDDGLTASQVGITGSERALLRANASRVRWKDVTIDFAKVSQIYNTGEQVAWIDGCRMIDTAGWTVEGRPPSLRNPWYATDSIAENKLYAYSGATLVRNSVARQISGDVFQNTGMVVGCDVDNVDGTILQHHTDLIQVFGARDNMIVADLNATDLYLVQTFFLEPSFEGTSDESARWLTNSAFVDINIDIAPVFRWSNNANAMVNAGGAPWSQMLSRFDHVLFDNVELANQRFMIRFEVTGLQALHAHNVVFRDFGFHPDSYAQYFTSGPNNLPSGIQFVNCYSHPDAAEWTGD